jgi:VIT1/CCC1 family predicted Fe2+/Mn2+ transporter
MSDGLTVPFALAAGLSGAVASASLVVTAGLAELAAGSITMGLGGYPAAKADLEHDTAERAREQQETAEVPQEEANEVAEVFRRYGLSEEHIAPLVATIRAHRRRWVDFMMRVALGLDAPDPTRAWRSALTIALSYIGGGLIPLTPYMLVISLLAALWVSVGVTLVALFGCGDVKGRFPGITPLRRGLQTVFIGGLAAGAAFTIARLLA